MACYHPQTVYRHKHINKKTGKRPITWNKSEGFKDLQLTIKCGRCIGCRLDKSREWAVRCVHEASLHNENCFLTLTYNQDPVSLNKDDFPLFMKRFRKKVYKDTGKNIRFFQCGEYGELFSRPHHHAIIFGFDFPDKVLWSIKNGVKLYRSAMLEETWKHGYSTIGDVTFESAAYVARYITKKITGEMAEKHYKGRIPEYITMSRREGIGKEWLSKYVDDVYKGDRVIVKKDIQCKPPRYYDKIYDDIDHVDMEKIKTRRKIEAKKYWKENSQERLDVKEKVKKAQHKKLYRTFEQMRMDLSA